MQLKLRHFILFLVACVVLIFSQLNIGALLAIAALMQMALLINGHKLSRASQLCALKIFLLSIPLFFFWGGIHSFVIIYFQETQYLFAFMALMIDLFLSFLISLQVVFSYQFMEKSNYHAMASMQEAFNNIKHQRSYYFKTTALIFIFSFIPWLGTDWKLVFSLMATHSYLNWSRLRLVLLSF